jgi:hypothetical protein
MCAKLDEKDVDLQIKVSTERQSTDKQRKEAINKMSAPAAAGERRTHERKKSF